MASYLASDPDVALASILFTKYPLLAYASKDLIALVDASSLNLVRTLAIWDAYPAVYGTDESVRHVAVDVANKWIIAAFGSKIAVWLLSGIEENTWRVHSTLSVSEPVTALACHAGRLVVATDHQLSLYEIEIVHDLPAWGLRWQKRTKQSTQIALSPSATVFATRSSRNDDVCIWLTSTGKLVQNIRHPRPIIRLAWRSQPSSSDQYVLYTTTCDAALRIFYPVLDAPRHLQLHITVDPYSFLPSSLANNSGSPVFPLNREHLRAVVGSVLRKPRDRNSFDESQRRRLTELYEEGWDLFARILDDGSIVIRAVANLDRRPPTLPKQFTLLHSLFNPPLERFPNELLLVPALTQLILITSPPTASHRLLPLPFFDARRDGLQTTCIAPVFGKYCYLPIQRISRSPEGHAVAIMRDGAVEVWKVKTSGLRLLHEFPTAKDAHVLTFHSGDSIAVHDPGQKTLSVRLGELEPLTISIPTLTDLFLIPPNHSSLTCLVGITETFEILQIHVMHPPDSSLTIHSTTSLPKGCDPIMIMPVDPMVWKTAPVEVLLSISGEGDLEFWAIDSTEGWRRTGRVRTNRKNITRARCSSTKKTVLVVHGSEGDEVSIWDSFESQFSSGLEYCETYKSDNPVVDLDWTATPDGQSILSVGFPHHILLLYQQRMTYFDQQPAWGVFRRIEIENLSRHPIADSVWITQGQLLTGTGHQILQIKPGSSITGDSPSKSEDLFETVVRKNGPLPDYHPQMLLQCLLWEKTSLVKQIIVRLAKGLKYLTPDERANFEPPSLPVEAFLEGEDSSLSQKSSQPRKNGTSLFDDHPTDVEENDGFSRPVVTKLIEDLEEVPLNSLSENENQQLLVFLQTALDIDEHRRALDADGFRYVISIRAFYLLNERILGPKRTLNGRDGPEIRSGLRERIRYRDIVWAFHSTSQEVLLNISTLACGGKMRWSDARALGIFLWMNSAETLKNQFEVIARNQYMSGEERDPEACCLFYFALGKVRLVLGLWRQAAWHPEQGLMLRFLANDFDQPRWKTAALKNAFALLGKRRYEMAAAFFLLGGSLKDAINVCVKQLNDVQLAIALARIVEGEDGPTFSDLLKSTIIPMAFKEGNRWLGLWAFWKLKRKDLSVRILVTPLKEYAKSLEKEGFLIPETAESNYDDPSLALMFSRLKSVSLQTVKGTSMIPGQQEFEFVLQIARVFCRMGCHALALDLVTSWSFDPPELPRHSTFSFGPAASTSTTRSISPGPPSPSLRRSKSRRRSTLLIDMDLNAEEAIPDTPTTSRLPHVSLPSVPETTELETTTPAPAPAPPEETPLPHARTGIGSLMQTAKRDVQVPEFDMGAFF